MDLFTKQRDQMLQICTSILSQNLHEEARTCNETVQQLDLHVSEIENKNSMFHAINLPDRKERKRRGLVDGVGMLAGELFGVLDNRFAKKYTEDIETLTENGQHTLELIKNQTSTIIQRNGA